MMAQKPLMLKEFLELDAKYESCADYSTTVRSLLEAELCGGGRLIRSRSKGALTKIAALINAVKLLSFSSSTESRTDHGSFFPRSISRKLRKSFSRTKGKEEEKKVRVKDIVRLTSFDMDGERSSLYFPSPVVSSCSSWSEGDSSASDSLPSSCGSSEFAGEIKNDSLPKSPNPSFSTTPKRRTDVAEDSMKTATCHCELKDSKGKGMERRGCPCEDEKEQLSPVSVLDFPYQDEADEEEEEDGATSPSFQQSLANIERTKHQLLQKIRRFETLADLDPVDLEQRFASFEGLLESSDHVLSDEEEEDEISSIEITAWELMQRLRCDSSVNLSRSAEKLLVDFFIEGLASVDVEELVSAASDWIKGGNYLNFDGNAHLMEMESNGRWRCFEDGKEEVAEDVEVRVLGLLLQELVVDLAALC